MLRWLFGWTLLGLAMACSAVDGQGVIVDSATQKAVIEDATGTVVKVGNLGFGLVPDEDRGTRYAPTEPLPEAFREDGLRVRFSGIPGDPSDVKGRRWGTPFEVTSIEKLESEPQ